MEEKAGCAVPLIAHCLWFPLFSEVEWHDPSGLFSLLLPSFLRFSVTYVTAVDDDEPLHRLQRLHGTIGCQAFQLWWDEPPEDLLGLVNSS